ncbi:hypothetical protein GCM10022232_87330 [Streptomyces plumbiresistens]|uniref:Uncharacterized protein n=1 Tax=Streptomyces plumbiresistens TaxID=511811 RepID=A0ABP7TLJ8_9ACTN
MSLVGGPSGAALRLAPDLDDLALGRAVRGITAARRLGPQDIAIARREQLSRSTGEEWDRRCHRRRERAGSSPKCPTGPHLITPALARERGPTLLVAELTRWGIC